MAIVRGATRRALTNPSFDSKPGASLQRTARLFAVAAALLQQLPGARAAPNSPAATAGSLPMMGWTVGPIKGEVLHSFRHHCLNSSGIHLMSSLMGHLTLTCHWRSGCVWVCGWV